VIQVACPCLALEVEEVNGTRGIDYSLRLDTATRCLDDADTFVLGRRIRCACRGDLRVFCLEGATCEQQPADHQRSPGDCLRLGREHEADYSLARDCGTNDRLLSIFNRLRPTRGLLSYDQSAVVQGGLDGDLSPCQNRLQCLFGRAASRRPELSAIAQHAAGVDYHGRGG